MKKNTALLSILLCIGLHLPIAALPADSAPNLQQSWLHNPFTTGYNWLINTIYPTPMKLAMITGLLAILAGIYKKDEISPLMDKHKNEFLLHANDFLNKQKEAWPFNPLTNPQAPFKPSPLGFDWWFNMNAFIGEKVQPAVRNSNWR